MNKFINGFLLALLVVYVVSPADLCPGPIDDVIAILMYLAANKRNLGIAKKDADIEVIDVDGKEI